MRFSARKKVGTALLIFIAALCCFFPWWQRQGRFPYAGKWRAENPHFRASYRFDGAGNCTTDYQTGTFQIRGVVCDYTMDGNAVQMSYSHASPTEKGVNLRYFGRLTPEENGRVLRVELQKGQRLDARNGQLLSPLPLRQRSVRFVKTDD